MRWYVTAAALACASGLVPQIQAGDTPGAPAPRPATLQWGKHAPRRGASRPKDVPPDTAVVTLEGVCSKPQSPCKTVITRADLDAFIRAFAPEASPAERRRMAVEYARALALASVAEQSGLEKNPEVVKELEARARLARMRVLSEALLDKVRQQPRESRAALEARVVKYYEIHKQDYEVAKVRRMAVPVLAQVAGGAGLKSADVKAELEKIRTRAAAGEDLAQLEQQAFKDLHILATPPPVEERTLRRGELAGDELKAFEMQPGEVSPVLDEPAALAIVKMESKETLPYEAVAPEIAARLQLEREESEMSRLTSKINAQFNLDYLGMAAQPELFGWKPGEAPKQAQR